jgi:hypothetical protein
MCGNIVFLHSLYSLPLLSSTSLGELRRYHTTCQTICITLLFMRCAALTNCFTRLGEGVLNVHHRPLLLRSDATDGGGSSTCNVYIVDRRSPKDSSRLYQARNARTSISKTRPNKVSCIKRSTTTSSTPHFELMAIHPVESPTKLLRNQRKPSQFAIKMKSRMVWWIRE